MILIACVFLISLIESSSTELTTNKGESNFMLFACHTTDFECFRRQYLALRDHALLGNAKLGIETYQTYLFQYADSHTCVRINGVEESQLRSISVSSRAHILSMMITMPVHIQQVRNHSMSCTLPDKPFNSVGSYFGPLKKFSGNATIEAVFPYIVKIKDNDVYFDLEDENLDVVMDIPDLSLYDRDSELELKLYEWSEWAYSMVQHVDVAERVILPFIEQYKVLFNRVPLKRFILLYPEESYMNIQFKLRQN